MRDKYHNQMIRPSSFWGLYLTITSHLLGF